MSAINLDIPPTQPTTRRARLVAILTAPTPVALVLVAVALAALVGRLPDPRPAQSTLTPVTHLVLVGVSAYPASATAYWTDQAGGKHGLDPWMDQPVRVAARSVVVAVGTDGASCTVEVDDVTRDSQTARGGVAVCSWSG